MTVITESNDTRIQKKAYFWNSLSGVLNAAQSAIILFFLMHFSNVDAGGIFSVAFSYANLFFTMAKYGVRNYQVTDVQEKYSFREYLSGRFLTTICIFLCSLVFVVFKYISGQYTMDKSITILLICSWKYIDSMEDVVYGMYQQKGRLDIGAFYYSLRIIVSTFLFIILVILGIPLVWVSAVVFAISCATSFFLIMRSIGPFEFDNKSRSIKNSLELLNTCFPLFLGYALSVYFGNLPKYLIDSYLTDTNQAYFNIIMMPAFVIQVLSQFIYQPIVNKFGLLWNQSNMKSFMFYVKRQYFILALLTILALIIGGVLGIPVLSFVFNVDLSPYFIEFMILLVGGGIFAVSNFTMVPLTTIRAQNAIAIGFVFVSIIGFIFGGRIVKDYGIMGASILYTVLNVVLATFLIVYLFLRLNAKQRAEDE